MLRTIEATLETSGRVTLKEAFAVTGPTRVLITILEEVPAEDWQLNEAAILSESSLAKDWLRPEEDEAWKHLNELPDIDEAGK